MGNDYLVESLVTTLYYTSMVRDEKHDAYYDPDTNEWVEDVCSDAECEFCKDRPDKHQCGP